MRSDAGYFEASPNHDAVALGVVNDTLGEQIISKIKALGAAIRPNVFILPNTDATGKASVQGSGAVGYDDMVGLFVCLLLVPQTLRSRNFSGIWRTSGPVSGLSPARSTVGLTIFLCDVSVPWNRLAEMAPNAVEFSSLGLG